MVSCQNGHGDGGEKNRTNAKNRLLPHWLGKEGFHFIQPGQPPTEAELAAMTKMYQEKIRHSPLWPAIVAELGEAEAEKALQGCRAELRAN